MSLDEIRSEKLKKIDALVASGVNPYPATTHATHTIAEVKAHFSDYVRKTETKEQDVRNEKGEVSVEHVHLTLAPGKIVTIAGRIMSKRGQGGTVFAHIYDGTERIQAYVKLQTSDDRPASALQTTDSNQGATGLGEGQFDLFRNADPSDFIEVTGECMVTKRGEPSILVTSWRMLAKALIPVPTEHFGIEDEEERLRKRYLDILLNPEVKQRIEMRSRFWNVCRQYLLERGFIEVETPVLEVTTGGADARPFTAHHNALDIDVHMRISAGELWQKRLMVAGVNRTFEIGRIFRNEGMSFEHAQDYTQLEYYLAYADYHVGMQMTQELYRRIADEVFGTRTFTVKGMQVDLGADGTSWGTIHFCDLLKQEFGIDAAREIPEGSDEDKAEVACIESLLRERGIAYDAKGFNRSRGVDLLWKSLRKNIVGPAFLIGVPVYLEPLAKRSEEDTRVVERFQVILAGSEMGKGFSELNDPTDQRQRFEVQQNMRDAGDDEAQMADWSYVEALEYGMPPTFGFGVSERLFSFLLDIPIREAQIFPLLKPREEKLSRKEAEAKYRSKKFVVIADPAFGYGVTANAIGQLGISIGGLIREKIFETTSFPDKDGALHYADGLYPMTNLAGTHEDMSAFVLKCHAAGVQVFDFSQIMRDAHSDAEMQKGFAAAHTADVPYIAVGALVPKDFEKEFLSTLELFK